MKFNKDFLREKVLDSVMDKIIDTSRWSIHHYMVFEHKGKYYGVNYSVGATECQDESPFQYADEIIECNEVEFKEVIKKDWVEVEEQMLNINDYTEMTKENFIEKVNEEELCPNNFGLNDSETCDGGDDISTCNKCWECAIENISFFNPLTSFQNNSVTILDDLCIVEKQYQQLDESRKGLKDNLMILMEQYGVDKFENDKISITYVKGSTGTTFDSDKFKKEHEDLHKEYQKPSVRAACVKFKVK